MKYEAYFLALISIFLGLYVLIRARTLFLIPFIALLLVSLYAFVTEDFALVDDKLIFVFSACCWVIMIVWKIEQNTTLSFLVTPEDADFGDPDSDPDSDEYEIKIDKVD